VARESVLPVRLRFAPWCMPGVDGTGLRELVDAQGRGGRHRQVGGVKFFMDGTVEGGTAWLEHADCHGQGTEAFRTPRRTPPPYGTCTRPVSVPPRTPSATRPYATSWTSSPASARTAATGTASSTSRRPPTSCSRASPNWA
jgi:hypothetical protein